MFYFCIPYFYFVFYPGKSEKEPNQYPFGTTYDEIYTDLKTKVD